MSKKNLIIAAAVLVVILVLIAVFTAGNKAPQNSSNSVGLTNSTGANPGTAAVTGTNANSAIASNTGAANKITATPAPIPVNSPLSAFPGSAEAPKQTVVTADKIPTDAIKLAVSASGFSPSSFSVKAGQSVILAISSTDTNTHVFIFPTAALMGLTTMVSGGETKTISFTAPAAGTYSFRDDIPSYRSNTGTMIVK